jgi:hypothetical protein
MLGLMRKSLTINQLDPQLASNVRRGLSYGMPCHFQALPTAALSRRTTSKEETGLRTRRAVRLSQNAGEKLQFSRFATPPVGRDSTIITRPSRRRIDRSMKFIFACQLKITRGDVGGGAPGVPFTHPRKACGGNSSAAYSLGAMQSGATPLVHADASADGRVQKGSGPGGFLQADSQLDIGKSTASSGRLWHERFISRALLQ